MKDMAYDEENEVLEIFKGIGIEIVSYRRNEIEAGVYIYIIIIIL